MQNVANEISQVKHSLTKNRSEHLGKDVWSDFVIPRFFRKVDLISTMPTRLEGGRGSGKTMLLRYLSYNSQFSPNRSDIPDDATDRIGLYWKADTQFLRLMQKRGLDNESWLPVFDHYLNLKLSLEVLSSIIAISESSYRKIDFHHIESSYLEGIEDFGFQSKKFRAVAREINSRIVKTELAIQNIHGIDRLEKLPISFLRFIVSSVISIFPCLKDTVYSVYIDEYENLLDYQQRVINTLIKGSEPPLIFNIAIKLNGMSETLTLSDEKLENRADYTIVNLDKLINENSFEIFVAEIFLKKLTEASPSIAKDLKIDLSGCSDASQLDKRHTVKHEENCRILIEKIFPGRTHQDLADEIFSTPRYFNKVVTEIERALTQKSTKHLTANDFILYNHKKATVVCTSLLYRKNLTPDQVLAELEKLKSGEANKFNNQTDWEHNNFIGCYLRIIRANKASSTFYSGFDVYSALSGGNVRHFLELCKSAFSLIDDSALSESFTVDRKLQHLAARNTSDELIKEIHRFTPLGSQLSNFVKAIGKIFQLCQDRDTQSETEVTHFGIKEEISPLTEEDDRFFKEAEKWGVLKAIESTKNKSSASAATYDYVLNPIYAPFFLISYRKGRKIEIEASALRKMYISGEAAINNDLRRSLRLWGAEEPTDSPKQATLL
ncbi:ORC-CDC6 family AAA ATPase [Pseudomonas oryzihabitans]|uniref:ORC-CDC6 family AAA ATPase n=1 Tax=Pseudomonas oryzihabitans TaxID=47885 RepID=UPI00165E756E|nr:hypothetical protein [Pseudomonas psychrotolerans]